MNMIVVVCIIFNCLTNPLSPPHPIIPKKNDNMKKFLIFVTSGFTKKGHFKTCTGAGIPHINSV